MGYTPSEFTTTAVINANTLFQNYDDEIQQLMADSGNYLEAEMAKVYTETGNIVTSGIGINRVENISSLKLQDGLVFNTIEVLGYYTKGDGGGGLFYWESTSTETDNGGTIIQATGITTGRWKRVFSGAVNVKWFGAKGDGITNDMLNINKAVNMLSSGGDLFFPKGDYPCEITLSNSNIRLICEEGTILRSTGGGAEPQIKITSTASYIYIDGFDLRGQTRAEESITIDGNTNNTSALYCLSIYGSFVTVKNTRARGCRYDSVYVESNFSNFVFDNCYIDSSARNPFSIIKGKNFMFINTTFRISEEYGYYTLGTFYKGLYLFDQEYNDSLDKFQNALFDNCIFISDTTVSGSSQVRFTLGNIDSDNNLNVTFRKCKFKKGATAIESAAVRLSNDSSNVNLYDCDFDERAFNNSQGITTLINSIFQNIVLGNASFTYGTYCGNYCLFENIRHISGSNVVLNQNGTQYSIINVKGYSNYSYNLLNNALDVNTNINMNPNYTTTQPMINMPSNVYNTGVRINGINTSGTTEVFFHRINGIIKSAILSNGNFQSATNSYGSTSDAKLKENIIDTSSKLDKLMKVRVRSFNYIGQKDKQIGVIAQEIEQIFPSVVYETEDFEDIEIELEDGRFEIQKKQTGNFTKNVKYSVIYMMMLKAMQEQQEIINNLESRIKSLEK